MDLKTKPTIVTKQQAIDELVDKVDDWDIECLTEFVKERLQDYYRKTSLKNIESDYNFNIMGIDYMAEEDNAYVKVVNTKASRLLIDGVKK
jgi:hypothetical protein